MMNKTVTNLFIFATGAAIGSVITWKLVKDKYARYAHEEIEAVREVYMSHNQTETNEPESEVTEKPVVSEPIQKFSEQDRIDYANIASLYNHEKGVPAPMNRPYVISPDEFDENGYQTISLTYYADGVIEDDFLDVWDEDEIDRKIGLDSLNHFGEYEEDSVFVRNDDEETDYEILRDTRRYSDIPKNNRHSEYE